MKGSFDNFALFECGEEMSLQPLYIPHGELWANAFAELVTHDPKLAHFVFSLPKQRFSYAEAIVPLDGRSVVVSVVGFVLTGEKKILVVLRQSGVVEELTSIISKQTDLIRENAKEIAQLKDQQSLLAEQLSDIIKQLAVMNRVLIRKKKEVEELALHDPLTGAYSRRYLDEYIRIEIAKSKRYGSPFTLIFCDLDNFKKINDTYGHAFGDFVLKMFVSVIESSIREGEDKVVRYGGDEFVIILSLVGENEALKVLERIAGKCAEKNITFSYGLVSSNVFPGDFQPADIIQLIDEKMYEHKRSKLGRNGEKQIEKA